MDKKDRFLGCLLGLAAGDAVGTTLEFSPRGNFTPLTGMVCGGPFGLQPGQWTDDTSMALCLATSLVEKGGFDPVDQMQRYCRWLKEGYLSSTGACFDIGSTTHVALVKFQQSGEPFSGRIDPGSAGNGSIMRLAPISMFFFHDLDAVEKYAAESSRTTHGAIECIDACRLFARIIWRALSGQDKSTVLLGDRTNFLAVPKIAAIARGDYLTAPEEQIRGTGYVVDSLQAALWSFYHSTSFEQAILTAANLGDDADTTAAVCGQVAGAFYGISAIPNEWLEKLALREFMIDLARRLFEVHLRS